MQQNQIDSKIDKITTVTSKLCCFIRKYLLFLLVLENTKFVRAQCAFEEHFYLFIYFLQQVINIQLLFER